MLYVEPPTDGHLVLAGNQKMLFFTPQSYVNDGVCNKSFSVFDVWLEPWNFRTCQSIGHTLMYASLFDDQRDNKRDNNPAKPEHLASSAVRVPCKVLGYE